MSAKLISFWVSLLLFLTSSSEVSGVLVETQADDPSRSNDLHAIDKVVDFSAKQSFDPASQNSTNLSQGVQLAVPQDVSKLTDAASNQVEPLQNVKDNNVSSKDSDKEKEAQSNENVAERVPVVPPPQNAPPHRNSDGNASKPYEQHLNPSSIQSKIPQALTEARRALSIDDVVLKDTIHDSPPVALSQANLPSTTSNDITKAEQSVANVGPSLPSLKKSEDSGKQPLMDVWYQQLNKIPTPDTNDNADDSHGGFSVEYTLMILCLCFVFVLLVWRRFWYTVCSNCAPQASQAEGGSDSGAGRYKIAYKPL